jgi:hypothetical protein
LISDPINQTPETTPMNSFIKTLAFCALLGASGGASATEVLMPNGDFSAGSTSWNQVGPITSFSYPSTGGNPDGYGVMDATNGEWGIWVGNADAAIPLDGSVLPGVSAGNTYVFKQDMRIEGAVGTNIGGFKIDFVGGPGGTTGDLRIPKIGDGSTWETYSYTIAIPAGVTGIKIVPLWGPNSIVGFDNFRVENGAVPPPPVIPGIPNPGFEIPGGAGWAPVGPTSFSYPTTGGNPGGYGVMNANGGQWGIWVANGDAILTIGPSGQLPLIAGTTATFAMDMKIESTSNQSNIGGFKVDFFGGPGGSTGDMWPAKSGSGTEWATYTFSVPIPLGVTGVKLVPLWGANSTVGYDNIRIVDTFAASIANGFNLSWVANPDYSYQPQSSTTGAGPWVNIGSPISGGAGSTIYQAVKAPFYQVLEITPTIYDNLLFNPGFEATASNSTGADGWEVAGGVPPGNFVGVASFYSSVFPQSGSSMLVLDGSVPAVASDVRSGFTQVTENVSYKLRFGVSLPVKTGPGVALAYSLFYRDEFGALIDPTGNKFTNIPTENIGSSWTTLTQTVVAPPGAFDVTVGFLLSLGANNNVRWVALIDNVSLDTDVVTTASTSTVMPAPPTTSPAVEVSWPTAKVPNSTPGRTYQVKSSTDLVNWDDFGGPVTGTGAAFSVTDALTPPRKFFRVSEVTP